MHNGSHPRINRCADTYEDVKLQLATVTIRWRNRAAGTTAVQTGANRTNFNQLFPTVHDQIIIPQMAYVYLCV